MDSIVEQLATRLRADPNDAEAYEALKAHYGDVGDLASLINLIEGFAGYQTLPALAADAYAEAARALQQSGSDPARVRELYQKALSLEPYHPEAAAELVAAYEDAGELATLAEFLDTHLRALEMQEGDPAFTAHLYTRLGDLWRTTFERPDVAQPCYVRALELDPSSTPAAYALRKLAQAQGDMALTAHFYALEAESETDPERKAQLYAKLAEVRATDLEDLDAAVKTLRAALALAPGDVGIMHQLASYLARRAETQPADDAARDKRRVAELYYQIAQGVPAEDALAYVEAALAAAPNHDGALALLEQIAPQLGEEARLPGYWVAYLAHAVEGPEVDQRRMYLAAAYERAGQIDDAIFCLEQTRSDGQAAELLTDLRARRTVHGSTPPSVAAAQATAQARAGDGRSLDEDDDPESADRPTAKPPTRDRRISPVSDRPDNLAPRLAELRRAVHALVASRRSDEAVSHCREILELEPGDPEAFSLLESHYRKNRDHAQLRELLLVSTRSGNLSVEARKLRLREVAALSETKLKDVDLAIDAWQSVVALDPADIEAGKSLKRLLQKAQRWDDLAAVLEREALATTSSQDKIDLLAQIAAIHRDKRGDLVEAAEALRQLLALRPDTAVREELCEMLLGNESYADAIPLLFERANEATDDRDKVRLLRQIAVTLDDKLGDAEGAFAAYLEVLGLRPKDVEVLDRMQRIDERSGNFARLLSTLERRAMIAVRAERPALFVRMGELAERELRDVDKAAEYYGNALDLEPGNEQTLGALYSMFEREARYEDLVELLRERALLERDPAQRSELERRMGRMLHEHLQRAEDAADSFRSILKVKEDEEALRFLLTLSRGQPPGLERADLAARLARLTQDADEQRDLLYERAELLATSLDKPAQAVAALQELLDRVDPEFEPAIVMLAQLCDQLGDTRGLATALQKRLDKTPAGTNRVDLAQRLADLYEGELASPDAAIAALLVWAQEDEQAMEPRRRLVPLLRAASRMQELLDVLDALAGWDDDLDARDQATLEAARIAHESLGDAGGAIARLSPLALDGHDGAFDLLLSVARASGRVPEVAALCVRGAQESTTDEQKVRHWRAAARLYAEDLGDAQQALEAALRMLASDMRDREHLSQVETYAAQAGAYARLSQVYEKLLKLAQSDDERVDLLVRHARVLDTNAGEVSDALDRILRACGLAPADDGLLARAEELAARAGRSEDLLVVYDRRRSKTAEDAGKVDILLRSARLADGALHDRERASTYLKTAIAVAKSELGLVDRIVFTAQELDRAHPEHGSDDALRAVIRAHRELAEKAEPELGAQLLLRAEALLRERVGDERAAFDLLRQSTTLFPLRDDLYDAFLARAVALERLDAVDAHLARAVDDAIDPKTAAVVLARRARLLEGELGRPQDAADVFSKLMQLRPDDQETAQKLRTSLRKARRFQDLLLAIHKQSQRCKNAADKLLLLKEAASTWDNDLKNRWEALDTWRKALELEPQDPEALAAVARLDRRSAAPPKPPADEELTRDGALDALASSVDPAAGHEIGAERSEPPAATERASASPSMTSAGDVIAAQQALHGIEAEQALAAAAAEAEQEGTDAATSAAGAASPHGRETAPNGASLQPSAASDAITRDHALPEPSETPRDVQTHEHALAEQRTPVPDLVAAEPAAHAGADHGVEVVEVVEVVEAVEMIEMVEAVEAVPDRDDASEPARLTKPPSLPPRRSRSYPPPSVPAAAPRSTAPHTAASVPPPVPTSTRPTAPPPVPTSTRPTAPPPVPSTRPEPATLLSPLAVPPAPSIPRGVPGVRSPSLPPPLPSQRAAGLPAAAPARPSAAPTVRPGTSLASTPPPLPSRSRKN